jgi:hypothetical protein
MPTKNTAGCEGIRRRSPRSGWSRASRQGVVLRRLQPLQDRQDHLRSAEVQRHRRGAAADDRSWHLQQLHDERNLPTGPERHAGRYYQWGEKVKPFRGLSVTTPPGSILAQDSDSWMYKGQWQRGWSNRLFTDVNVGLFGLAGRWLQTSTCAPSRRALISATTSTAAPGGSRAMPAALSHSTATSHRSRSPPATSSLTRRGLLGCLARSLLQSRRDGLKSEQGQTSLAESSKSPSNPTVRSLLAVRDGVSRLH